MGAIIDSIFSFMADLFGLITQNWYLAALVGLFVLGSVLTLVFSLFKKKKAK